MKYVSVILLDNILNNIIEDNLTEKVKPLKT